MLDRALFEESLDQVQDIARRDAFIRLIEQYEPAMRRLASAYADRPADREDLFQEIAVALWQAVPHFRGDASERTWLYRIAHNVAISFSVRLRTRQGREDTLPDTEDHPCPAIDTEREILRAEKQALLLQAIRTLPAIDKQLVLLHLEGLSYAQIEEVCGISQSAIASRLSRLRDRLREHVQAAGGRKRHES